MLNQQNKNRLLIVTIFGLSVVPMLIAGFLYRNSGAWLDTGINNGRLVIPPIAVSNQDFSGFDEFSANNLAELKGRWLIVNVMPKPECHEVCLEAILKTRQLRLMLNKDLSRTRRVVLVAEGLSTEAAEQLWLKDSLLWRLRTTGDRQQKALFQQFLQADKPVDEAVIARLLAGEDRQFALSSDLIRLTASPTLMQKINAIMAGGLKDGMMFLIDPLGNLILWYGPGFDPYQVKSDLLHLLKISQIG